MVPVCADVAEQQQPEVDVQDKGEVFKKRRTGRLKAEVEPIGRKSTSHHTRQRGKDGDKYPHVPTSIDIDAAKDTRRDSLIDPAPPAKKLTFKNSEPVESKDPDIVRWIDSIESTSSIQQEEGHSDLETERSYSVAKAPQRPSAGSPRPVTKGPHEVIRDKANQVQLSDKSPRSRVTAKPSTSHYNHQTINPIYSRVRAPEAKREDASVSTRRKAPSPATPQKIKASTRSPAPPVDPKEGCSTQVPPRPLINRTNLEALNREVEPETYPVPSSVDSVRGSSIQPLAHRQVRISAVAELELFDKENDAQEISFPVFNEETWDQVRERDQSLPAYRSFECFGCAQDQDTDVWLGLKEPYVLKLSSTLLKTQVPYFTSRLQNSKFYVGKGKSATPRYGISISIREDRHLTVAPAEMLRNVAEEPVDHAWCFRQNFLEFMRALHGERVHDVGNLRTALKRIHKYFKCSAAVAKCLRVVEEQQKAELDEAIEAEAPEYLRFGHRFGAEYTFRTAFDAVVYEALELERPREFLRGGVPKPVREIVELQMGMVRRDMEDGNLWRRAWNAFQERPKVPTNTI